MVIEMDLTLARLQVESIREMCRSQLQVYEQLQKTIKHLSITISRESPMYDSTQKYFVAVLLPLVKGAALLSELIVEANVRFIEEYLENIDDCSLNSAELEEQIKLWELQITTSQMRLRALADSSMDPRNKAFQISENMMILGTYGGIKAELKQKLDQLISFHNSSSAIFDKVNQLNSILEQGCRQADSCWNERDRQFVLPPQAELLWAAKLEYCYYIRKKQRIEDSDAVPIINKL
ncbi:hypothetical protein LI951_09670 [Enterococcus sp. BWT-B8]|uniref:hypothetical protein n=1 Tax=Enterococcus sp. BWT-B8 TaxID=2885157 RepID=UPI001E626C0E|nr:hypothetical protein [Enterococcus sp. BWT-B8]MCB5952332.1 hypothetical protein [Enterococcus sp. BWT-B8]